MNEPDFRWLVLVATHPEETQEAYRQWEEAQNYRGGTYESRTDAMKTGDTIIRSFGLTQQETIIIWGWWDSKRRMEMEDD